MNAERHRRVSELFRRAVEMGPSDRATFLDRECRDDSTLRDEVSSLIAHDEIASIELPADVVVATTTALLGDLATSMMPDRIGPYKILDKIGEGGMGVVYLAEQEAPLRRRVALKVIKPGMDSKQVLARFEAERQALALMSHPNIATVFDAGATETGRPYFVMEFIKGVPITEYCDTQRLTLRERLDLFVQVCQAVQHAHERGIIHRDLKPSNVLVEIKDGRPVPKIIDFGVAKATEHRLTEKTVFTEYGQLIGTPEYMSPEQAEMSVLDVDARTDVYSLGVVLYEMLSGALPFESSRLREAGYAKIQQIIREEDPPTPSARISGLGAVATAVSQRRQLEARALTRTLRGDLDWVVMKALRKDRTRRYGSANELIRDIERYMRHERVAPGPAWLRSHQWGGLASSIGLSALLGMLGVFLTQWAPEMALEKQNGLDLLFSMRGPLPAPQNVCVVAIDDDSFKVVGRDPTLAWPRGLHAELIRTLKREGAKAVAIDVLFVEQGSDAAQDDALSGALGEAGNVVLGSLAELTEYPLFKQAQIEEPYKPFAKASAAIADVNIPTDRDGVIRYAWPARGGRPGLALAAYELATGDTSHRTAEARLLDFYGPSRAITTVSMYQALDPEKYLPVGFFKGKLVFVGWSPNTALWGSRENERDTVRTPFSGNNGAVSGVEVHATLAANLLEGRSLQLLPHVAEVAILVLLPFAIFVVRPAVGFVVFIGLEVLLWMTAYLLFARAGVWMPLFLPAVVQLPLAYLVSLVRVFLMRRP